MVKVKAEASAGQVAPPLKVSGKKKKGQKTVLKVVSKRNVAAQPSVSLKTKKNRKRRNKGKKGTQNETHSETVTKEVMPQELVSESKEQQIVEKDKNAPSNDTALDALKDDKLESGKNEANTQSKKKRKRRNKRKVSEAIEGIDDNGTSEATEDKDAGAGDMAQKEKASKRQKVEKQEDEGSTADKDVELKKSKKKKVTKYILFIGNLPFEATEEDVREHFKVVGDSIVRVTLVGRKKDGRGKGYGFVELANATAYTAAIKLNMSQFKDRKINVEYTTGGKKSKRRTSFIKLKTRKLLGQKGKKRQEGRKKTLKGLTASTSLNKV